MSVSDLSAAKLAMNSNKAASVEDAVGRKDCVLEIKYDGWRLLSCISSAKGIRMYTRGGNSKSGYLPHVEKELARFPLETWLDGEAVTFNPDGTQHWGGTQSLLGSSQGTYTDRTAIKYVIFDVLFWDGEDVRSKPFRERRKILEDFEEWGIGQGLHHLLLAEQFPAIPEAHDEILAFGFEGSMVKDLNAPYVSARRTNHSLKLKAKDTIDVIVTGYNPPKEGWIKRAGLIGSVKFEFYEGGKKFTGKCSGMTIPERAYITKHQDELLNTVIEVSYMQKINGNLRHPNFVRFRKDKTPEEVRKG